MKLVPVNKGKYFALVDDEDYDLASQCTWTALDQRRRGRKSLYAYTGYRVGDKKVRNSLHRLLMGNPPGEVDHVNRNGLDCQRHNMRVATHGGNMSNVPARNRSGLKGAYRNPDGSWKACIRARNRSYHLGTFRSAQAAHAAYCQAALKHHGEFAGLS